MKNKIKLIVVLSLVTIVAALFSGCFLSNFNRVKSISLVGTPKTTYYVGEQFDGTGLKIQINYVNENQDSVLKDITEEEFNIDFKSDKVGTYVCTITLKANANVSLYFDYSVIEKDGTFTEGDGSQSSPYVVYTADQFAHIGDMAGQYYVLGDNVDLTGKTVTTSWPYAYNKNLKSFVLDGNGYSISVGGNGSKTGTVVFKYLYNASIKNLVLNVKPGSKEVALTCYPYGNIEFDGIVMNGSMVADQNDGILSIYSYKAKTITVKNCVNNVNITSTAEYYAAFLGFLNNTVNEISFVNCVNNGNLEGSGVNVFIGNGAHQAKKINIENCSNNGKLVGASVGWVAFNHTRGSYDSLAKYSSYASKFGKFEVEMKNNSFVSLEECVVVNGNDVTFVRNENGEVVFSEAALAKIAELGAGAYGEGKVHDWVQYSTDKSDTIHVYSAKMKSDVFKMPYKQIIQGTKTVEEVDDAIYVGEDGNLYLAQKTASYNLYARDNTNNQSYCYFIYDANGVMKYCGQIKFADIQNA